MLEAISGHECLVNLKGGGRPQDENGEWRPLRWRWGEGKEGKG